MTPGERLATLRKLRYCPDCDHPVLQEHGGRLTCPWGSSGTSYEFVAPAELLPNRISPLRSWVRVRIAGCGQRATREEARGVMAARNR